MGTQSEKAKFGDVANGHYSEFETDGTYKANGDATCFLDELGDVLALQQTGTGVSFNTTENTVDFITTSNLSDYIYCNIQMNHDRVLDTIVYPHIHFFQANNNVPNFLLQYRFQANGQAKTTAWTNLACNIAALTYTSGTLNQIARTSAGINAPTGDNVSSILQLRIIRDNANTSGAFAGADPYTGIVGIMSVDVHKQIDTLGSRQQYIK